MEITLLIRSRRIIPEMIIKGNKVGISVSHHKSKPAFAPAKEVEGKSNISNKNIRKLSFINRPRKRFRNIVTSTAITVIVCLLIYIEKNVIYS